MDNQGDGTVALISLGGMCIEGWKRRRWNPVGVKVITVEVRLICSFLLVIDYTRCQLPHHPTLTEPRGGANTSDHIDILGSTGLNELLLRVVSGHGEEVEENIISNIRAYAGRMKWD